MSSVRLQKQIEFVQFVSDILQQNGVAFSLINERHYVIFKAQGKKFILDYLVLPYQKPTIEGFHFTIDLYLFHRDALQNRLCAILGLNKTVFARKCSAKKIDKPKAQAFFDTYHLSGYLRAKFNYGLFLGDELVAAISFAQARNINKNGQNMRSYELIGFCQKNNFSVVGGLSKLIAHFVKHRNAQHIATYIDRDWSSGKGFEAIGFQHIAKLPPLPFRLDWQTGARHFPDRTMRKKETFTKDFDLINSGYLKFEHLYQINKAQH